MKLGFLKKRSFWITFVIISLVIGGFALSRSGNKGPFYDTAPVEAGTLAQTVEVTGELKPDARIGLAFKSAGRLEVVNVKVGDKVKKGQVLAELEARDARFAADRASATLSIASANLQARLAGEMKESIQISQASVDQAQASYDKAVSDLTITKSTVEDEYKVAELSFQNASRNLVNSGANADQSVDASYVSLRTNLLTALGSLRTAMTDGDALIGVDDGSANDNYESILGLYDQASMQRAKNAFPALKQQTLDAEVAVKALTTSSTKDQTKAAAERVKTALESAQSYLDDVKRVLAASLTNAYLTEANLSSKRATIDADRTQISAQLTTVSAALQSIKTAELSTVGTKESLQIAFETAQVNLQIANNNRSIKVKQAETNVVIQEAALNSAKAALALKKAPVREIDVAALRAQVQDAQTAYAQAIDKLVDVQIIAPTDGIISDIDPSVGEQVSPSVVAVSMVGTDQYTVEALVPESDIVKTEVGQDAVITLDAFGDDVTFKGKVIAENPDQTKVQDAIYYKTYITIEGEGKDIKPGMTANIIVKTGTRENTLIIPSRAVRENDGQKSVRVLEGDTPKDVNITTGLRGDEGRLEVMSGLTAGQQVIIGELTADEYNKRQMEAATAAK